MYLSKEFFSANVFTVEAEVTSVCNFACKYCIDPKAQKQYIDFDALYRFLQTLQSNKLALLMNGGEPTMHPGLFDFCKRAYSISNLQILLYSNMSASNELYKDLQCLNVKLCPSYHENYFTLDQLAKKLENLTYQHVYVPCTKANIDNIVNIAKAFKSIKLLLLDNQDILPTIVNKLIKFDKDVANQYKIMIDNKKHKTRQCNSQYKYLNIDGNGDIYQCMFLENCCKLGNIKDSTKIDISKFKHICTNKYCCYEF